MQPKGPSCRPANVHTLCDHDGVARSYFRDDGSMAKLLA
jgi:hypothetical protein